MTPAIDKQLLADLFDVQPEPVVWLMPILHNETIIDLEVQYANDAAAEVMRTSKKNIIGGTLKTTGLVDRETLDIIFEQCAAVWRSGVPAEHTYHSPRLDKYFRVQRSKVLGGILSITRDRTNEVKTALQLQEQAALLTGIIEGSPNGIAYYRSIRNDKDEIVDFRLQLANRRSADITGFTLDELYKHTVQELMDMRGHSKYLEECREVVETGNPKYYEFYSQAHKQWIAFSIVKHGDGYLLNYMDITNTKIQSEQIAGILDASINGIVALEGICNQQGEVIDLKILQINKAFTKILGLEASQVVGKTYLSIFPKTKEAGVFDLHVQVLQTGEPVEKELYYDGEGYDGWYRIVISKMNETTLVHTFTNITEAVRDKKKAEESAKFLQEVINGSHTGILVVTPVYKEGKIIDFRFKSANQTLAKLVNAKPEDLIGELHSKWFPEYEKNGSFQIYVQIIESGQAVHFENHFENARNDKWMDVSARKIGNDVLVSFHDFTLLKKLQIQLMATIDELERSNERLSQFTHVASHDLKEPLRKIIMFSNLMEERYGGSLDEDATLFLSKIKQTSFRMQALINDLLSYSQVNTKPESFDRISLDQLMQSVLSDLEATVAEKNATVHVSPLPLVQGDSFQLNQLFQNLLSNALKFHKKGESPKVSITASFVKRNNLPASIQRLAKASSYHSISVKDEGIGFDKIYTEKIFQLFQRLHGNSEYEGTGIGLAIVSRVVENHEGFIIADSEEDKGATFTAYLPAYL